MKCCEEKSLDCNQAGTLSERFNNVLIQFEKQIITLKFNLCLDITEMTGHHISLYSK